MAETGGAQGDVDRLVRAALARFLEESGRERYEPSDTDRLDVDVGLSSFDVTTLLTQLTSHLDAASAGRLMSAFDIATFGDLCRLFAAALATTAAAGDDELAASRRRAAARRTSGR